MAPPASSGNNLLSGLLDIFNKDFGGQNQQGPKPSDNPAALSPAPNDNFKVIPKIPVTPEKITGFYNQPVVIPQIPPFKYEAIKPTRTTNKTIKGYLKSIEKKMDLTEKLLKNLLKLQNLQILQEKILNERRRELYYDTFQEYLLDKTVEFRNKDEGDDPDCTCINLPKNPKPPSPPDFSKVKQQQTQTQTQPQTQGQRQGQTPQTRTQTFPRTTPIPHPAPDVPQPGVPGQTPRFPNPIPQRPNQEPSGLPDWLNPNNLPKIPVIPLPMPGLPGEQSVFGAVRNFQQGFRRNTAFLDPILNPIDKLFSRPDVQLITSGGGAAAFGAARPLLGRALVGAAEAATTREATQLSLPLSKPTAKAAEQIVPEIKVTTPKPPQVRPGPSQIVQPNLFRQLQYRNLLIKKIEETGFKTNIDLKNAPIERLKTLVEELTGESVPVESSLSRTIRKGPISPQEEQILNTPISGPNPPVLKASGGILPQNSVPASVSPQSTPFIPFAKGGIQDVELHDASSMNFFRHLSGTGNFANGGIVDSVMKIINNIIPGFNKRKGLRGASLKRIMHGTAEGIPDLIRSGGFKEQTGMLGKGVYGSVKGWVADTYRGAGRWKGILPGQGPRLDMLVPEASKTLRGATVVSARQANRGLSIAEGILSGKYTGAKAQSLMPLLARETPTMAQAFMKFLPGITKVAGTALDIANLPVVGDALFPEGTSQYDQITGPNAANLNPTLSSRQRGQTKANMLEMSQNNLSTTTNKKAPPAVIPLPPIDMRIPVKKPAKQDETMMAPPGVDIPNSNVPLISRRTTGVNW